MAAAGAGLAGELDVLLPLASAAGLRSDLSMRGVVEDAEPGLGGCWLAAAGAGLAGELEVLFPLSSMAGLRSALSIRGVVAGAEPTAGGCWLAAAGAGVEGEVVALDCANAMVAPLAMARAVREWVRTLETFMGVFQVAALGRVE